MLHDWLADVERRAAIARVSVGAVLDRAGVQRTTWSRWQRKAQGAAGGSAPRLDTMEAVSAALAELEDERAGATG